MLCTQNVKTAFLSSATLTAFVPLISTLSSHGPTQPTSHSCLSLAAYVSVSYVPAMKPFSFSSSREAQWLRVSSRVCSAVLCQSPAAGIHNRQNRVRVRVMLSSRLPIRHTDLYFQDSSQSSRQGGVCIREQRRDLPMRLLTGLLPYIYSAWLSGMFLWVLFNTWLNSVVYMPTLQAEHHARQISRSDRHLAFLTSAAKFTEKSRYLNWQLMLIKNGQHPGGDTLPTEPLDSSSTFSERYVPTQNSNSDRNSVIIARACIQIYLMLKRQWNKPRVDNNS